MAMTDCFQAHDPNDNHGLAPATNMAKKYDERTKQPVTAVTEVRQSLEQSN